MSERISTAGPPAATGTCSQAVRAGNFVYTSGQISLDPEAGALKGKNITEQTVRVMKSLSAVLSAAGTSFDNVMKTACYLTARS